MQVAAFVGSYVTPFSSGSGDATDGRMYFNWLAFGHDLGNHVKDIVSANFHFNIISRQDATAGLFVDQISAYLLDTLSVEIDNQTKQELCVAIAATFYNLKERSSHGFLDFDSSTVKGNSSWEYRLCFAARNGDDSSRLNSLVTTILLVASIVEKSSWWGLSHSSRHTFSAVISSTELVVEEGFKRPSSSPLVVSDAFQDIYAHQLMWTSFQMNYIREETPVHGQPLTYA